MPAYILKTMQVPQSRILNLMRNAICINDIGISNTQWFSPSGSSKISPPRFSIYKCGQDIDPFVSQYLSANAAQESCNNWFNCSSLFSAPKYLFNRDSLA
jgi:hypothetical protein